MFEFPDPANLVIFLGILALIPAMMMMFTSFIKLAVVFALLRNALGVQQIPPNMAIYGLAIILTIYIMYPIGHQIYENYLQQPHQDNQAILAAFVSAREPLQTFLQRNADGVSQKFFYQTAQKLWPKDVSKDLQPNDLLVLMPAFTITQLTEAFKIGFVIYLPFIVIDLIVANILLALGMMMMSPITISLPFKLLLFVMINGWSRIVESLVLSF